MARKQEKKKEKKTRSKVDKWLTPESLVLITAWVRDGATDEIIAKKMQIARSTLSEWKIKYELIGKAMRENKEIVDADVENGLLKRARGYQYTEEMAFKCKREYWDDKGRKCSEEVIKTVFVLKEMPPDPKAAQYWLNNRKPETWKASREDSAEGEGEVEVVIPEADKEQFE